MNMSGDTSCLVLWLHAILLLYFILMMIIKITKLITTISDPLITKQLSRDLPIMKLYVARHELCALARILCCNTPEVLAARSCTFLSRTHCYYIVTTLLFHILFFTYITLFSVHSLFLFSFPVPQITWCPADGAAFPEALISAGLI